MIKRHFLWMFLIAATIGIFWKYLSDKLFLFPVPNPHRNRDAACVNPPFTPRILSYDPLIIHLENFVTPKERQHLIEIA